YYRSGRFQLQFSLHSTDPDVRKSIVPVRSLDFQWMGLYGERFREPGDQRITLNFAAAEGIPFDPGKLLPFFDPEHFLIKITPLNPTLSVSNAGLKSVIDPCRPETGQAMVRQSEEAGYKVILSIGEHEENAIGSNCGQYATYVDGEEPQVRQGYESERYEAKTASSSPNTSNF
ncbi:MAG: radical SAM protein, partial [Planctomycetes bacterium]|nr:radical SAM protein [Planctomycetota bacterium]